MYMYTSSMNTVHLYLGLIDMDLWFQLFTPTEKLDNPVIIGLIFAQVVMDTLSTVCIRIQKEDKVKIKSQLGK